MTRPGEMVEAGPPPAPGAEEGGTARFPVVGIGASAGGLEAFRRLFSTMPADTGLAFVLIPHLDPTRASLMVDLIARSTAMPVMEAEEDRPVEPDHVYLLPPNRYMTIGGGRLHLTGPVARGGMQTSIDLFLRSLAEDRQEEAIGIILSGTGSHGTLGLQAIKANGGMTLVQDPLTAEYDGMPRSAIATGLIDAVLPPEEMATALLHYLRQFFGMGDRVTDEADGTSLDQVLALLRARTRFDFRCYRKTTLLRRARRRMGLNKIEQIPDYLAFLGDHPDEITRLAKDLLISVTSFFRDRDVFKALGVQVARLLAQGREADEALRVWVPACATGEEAYSIAMVLIEQLAAVGSTCRLQVFATDVAEDALEVGRRGSYPESITADVSAERLARFFLPLEKQTYQVTRQLREAITFAPQNVLCDPPFSKLDLISCRNLLIYLEADVQQKLVGLFHFVLREGGLLLLGPAETIGQKGDLFEAVSRKARIYRRIGPSRAERLDMPIVADGDGLGAGRRVVKQENPASAARVEPPHATGDLEGSAEDLRTSNEEMMSVNEEIQAVNEELETSKEEMQSLNEELNTVNGQLKEKVEKLRATAEHLRMLATVMIDSNDAVTVHDLEGRITAWNHGGTRMYGYTEAEALQMNVEQLLPVDQRPDPDGLLARLQRGERVDSLEARRLAKDGRIIDVLLTGTPLKDEAGRIVGMALTEHDVTERKALEKEVLEIATEEQRRIGHDLHDTVGQEMTALGLMADSLMAALQQHSPMDVPLAAKIVQGVRRTLDQVRALSRGLVPVEVRAQGLMAALADLAARIDGESGVACRFACPNPVLVENNSTATHLYRIAQEAVGNALKHGQGRQIDIELGVMDGHLTLRITDDGIGIPGSGGKSEGLGLKILRYRADSIRATLSIESPPRGGTQVTCILRENSNLEPTS